MTPTNAELEELLANLDRVEAWMRSRGGAATIWLHVAQARVAIHSLAAEVVRLRCERDWLFNELGIAWNCDDESMERTLAEVFAASQPGTMNRD